MISGPSSRPQVASALVGVAVGALLVGLVMPFVWNDPARQVAATSAGGLEGRGTTNSGLSDGSVEPGDAGTAPGSAGSGSAGPGSAPTDGTSDAGQSAALDPTAPTGPATATDVGVTDTEIRIGVLLHDLGPAAQFGITAPGADIDNQRAAWQAFIDEANQAGGIQGRLLAPTFRVYDVTSEDSARAACNQFAQDDQVFAVLAMQLSGSPVLCFTQQYDTLLMLAGSLSEQYFRQSEGLAFATDPSQDRSFRNQVAELHRQGVLEGRTIGVLTEEVADDNVAVEEALLPALEALGYEVAHYAVLAGDQGTSQSQVPLAVQQMRTKGVDLVFFGTNLIAATNFAQTADAQGYRPLYATNDSNSMTNDIFLTGMPASFEAIGITSFRVGEWRIGTPEPAYDAGCREQFERASGLGAQRNDGDSPYGVAMNACNLVRIFVAGLRGAGTELTRVATSQALQRLASFDMAFTPSGTFGGRKFDAPDFVRTSRNDAQCQCWMPVDEFRLAAH